MMPAHDVVELTGHDLTVGELMSVVTRPECRVAIAPRSAAAIDRAHAYLAGLVTGELIYGVNTGFGPMASCVLGREQLAALQCNLIRSHCTGLGEPIDSRFVLAAMVVRLNTFANGASGVSGTLARTLEAFVNARIIPVVPAHGAVGASGDLVQLAHVALALLGEGEITLNGVRMPAGQALERVGLRPHELAPKEGLALINGTAMMTGIAAVLCAKARRLVDLAIVAGALSLEIVRAFDDGLAPELHELRRQPGQCRVARRMRECLAGSGRLRNRHVTFANERVEYEGHRIGEAVQEVYSLRCIPQILGPIEEVVASVTQTVEAEMNAVTDNPVVIERERVILHGGNFHGDYVAAAMDHLKSALVKLTMLAERRINFMLNANLNKMLPPFLNLRTPGFNLGLQGLQFVATSTTAHSQTLAFPQYVHSIPTNGDNQDVVSLGTDAALLTRSVIDNAFIVAAIEAVTLAQAVDCLGIDAELSPYPLALYRTVRSSVPVILDDRASSGEIEALRRRLEDEDLAVVTAAAVGRDEAADIRA